MKPNVIVALLIGLGLGFAIGKFVGGPGGTSSAITAAGKTGHETEATLALKSADMPAGTFTGMTESQKYAAMKVMNDNDCTCGCGKGTLANCVKTDPNCPNSPAKLKQAVELAKQGKSASEIQQVMFGGGAAAPPARRGPPPEDTSTVYKVPLDNSPVKGKPDALITIVEFSDYQCPFCSRGEKTMQDLQKEYGAKLRVAMKQNPLSFHERAKPAALAAMAAGEQGKYWEMHEKLFANQQALDDASLEKYAKEIGLNVAKWKASLKNAKFEETIGKDQALASQLGANGTPAFFINGRKLSGAQPIDRFKAIIDEELPKAEQMVKSGVKATDVYAKIIEKGTANAAPPPPPPGGNAPPPAGAKKIEFPADSPVFGPKNAKVTIVEWSDFECPFCSRVIPTLKQIKEKYAKDVRVVFRHQPLPFHSSAQLAAEASMAAHEQGKFWEFHDKLFENQKALDRASLEKYAQDLKLDVNKFKAALDSGKFKDRVKADSDAGSAVGANGTPTFFINGREFVGAQPFESFKVVIDEEIAKADKLLASGTKPEQLYTKLMEQAIAAAPSAPPPGQPPPPPPVQNVQVGKAPVKGPPNAPVTIVAWSDFECPFCGRVIPTLKQLENDYKGKIRIAFKNQPLPFHQSARPAAAAALAANEQGKFWEYHDKLFENQRALDRASLEKYAQELGLDMAKFKAALDSNKFDAQITADSEEGTKLGANGTPTFFINGRQVVGAVPISEFKSVIDDELKKKK